MLPILLTEESWMNSNLSIARHYGAINIQGHRYIIVDKKGRDLYECSRLADEEGREKAIESGEPADLIRADFQNMYRKLGRDKFIVILKTHPEVSTPNEMSRIVRREK